MPAASAVPVKHCLALETSPNRIFWHAILAFCSAVISRGTLAMPLWDVLCLCLLQQLIHLPAPKESNLLVNSDLPMRPRPKGRRNNMNGNNRNNFHARHSITSSLPCAAVSSASHATRTACRNRPFTCTGQLWRTEKRFSNTCCKLTSSRISHSTTLATAASLPATTRGATSS